MSKRVLIVDDDSEILLMLQFALEKLGLGYQVVTALGSDEAMKQIENDSFDLVVTDYMMNGITGVDLARAMRRIAPDTQVILMTAYGTRRLRDTTEYLGINGYLDKPFTLQKIQEVIQHTLESAPGQADLSQPKIPVLDKAVGQHMQALQANTNARFVLLLTSGGYPLHVVGPTDDLRLANISALIAANFLAAAEMADLLSNQTVFKSTFHEGDDFNVYAYDIDGAHLLAVVFDAKLKPGVVWFYTKQAAAALAPLLGQPSQDAPDNGD